ncbi:MAG: methylmalonyl-CoA mutase, partial [Gemmatimonadetes bacterium]|nr:methylmalonyl-CoA mutase [Gemmatimonadota bacterium]
STLERVREAAASGENVMPSIMDAVEAYATGGEVCSTLESVFGHYREPVSF